MRKITKKMIEKFKDHLIDEEKSEATINKYIHDIAAFKVWCGEREINRSLVLEYKNHLLERYAPRSVNSAIS